MLVLLAIVFSDCQVSRPINAEQAADLAEMTAQGLRFQSKADDPPLKGPNGYPCREFGAWLKRRHLRGIGVTVDGVKYDLDTEKARLTHHQANIAALNEEVARGNLIPADIVIQRWQEQIGNARGKLLTMPSRLASVFGQHVEAGVRLVVYEILEELRHDWQSGASDLGDGRSLATAAAVDDLSVGGSEPVPQPGRQRRARKVSKRPRAVPEGDT